MENAVQNRLQSVQFGKAQRYQNLAILPLIAPADGACQYRTLGEALAAWDLAITEVSEAGSVPNLMVVNRATQPVLLLDGEELAGARQNRVLNTSILIKGCSETRIPVSCTEQGRWAYTTRAFSESGNIMALKARARKTRSVHESLESLGSYQSNQGDVWNSIDKLYSKVGFRSPTAAMSDLFKAQTEALLKCDEVFQLVPGQVGLLAFVDGQLVGAEMISRSAAYARLHAKLVRSYALEALMPSDSAPAGKPGEPAPAPGGSSAPPKPAGEADLTASARQFFAEVAAAKEQQFPSVGLGTDCRYEARNLVGTALVHEQEAIHAAFFRLDDSESPSHRRRPFPRRHPLG